MNINEKGIVVLSDNNKYMTIKKTEIDGKIYYYFVDIKDDTNIKFLYEDGIELVEIEDANLIESVITKMFSEIDVDEVLKKLKIEILETKAEGNM